MTKPFPTPPPHIALKMYGDDIYVVYSKGVRVGLIKYRNEKDKNKSAIALIEQWTDDVLLLRYMAEVVVYLNEIAVIRTPSLI